MATYISTDSRGNVTYEIEPVDKTTMLPNANSDASEAAQAAQAAARAAQEAAAGITESAEQIDQNTEDITDLKDALTDIETDLTNKANIDGSYEAMTVGNAEQLVSSQFVEDKVPYLFRTSGGSADIGNREEDVIVGGSLVFNQRFKIGSMAWSGSGYNGVFITKVDDYTFLVKGTATQGMSARACYMPETPVINHVYYINSGDDRLGAYIGNAPSKYGEGIAKPTVVNDTAFLYGIQGSTDFGTDGIEVKPQLTDITAMFGSEIADYIHSLEIATAGAGVAWLKKHFPKQFDNGYQAYNPGSMEPVRGLKAHKMVGFNQLVTQPERGSTRVPFNKETFTRVTKDKPYEITFGNVTGANNWRMCISAYDMDGNIIEDESDSLTVTNITVSSGAGMYQQNRNGMYLDIANGILKSKVITFNFDGYVFVNIGFGDTSANTKVTNACMHFVWSGTRNGEYEPYVEHTYALDDSVVLRGIPKLDENNELYYDGDIYRPDGTVERRFTEVRFDSNISRPSVWFSEDENKNTWGFYWNYKSDTFPYSFVQGQAISDKFSKVNSVYGIDTPYIMSALSAYISFRIPKSAIDTPVDASDLSTKIKAWIDSNPFTVIAEITEPTTEQAEPYTTPQIVDDWGTEEYVIDDTITVPIPVGHDTKYPANLRDKLQHLPDLADADGYYAIKQVGTQMILELFRIPKAPIEDGTYTLKAIVSGGTPTYTWEVVE